MDYYTEVTRKYLDRIRVQDRRVNVLLARQESLLYDRVPASPMLGDGIHGSSHDSKCESWYLRWEELEEKINDEIDILNQMKVESTVDILELTDDRARRILNRRCIQLVSWARIVDSEGLTRQYIMSLFQDALHDFYILHCDKINAWMRQQEV